MGLLTGLLTLPVSGPLRGALWVVRQVHEAAEAEHRDPAAIRRALAELERQLERGEIDEPTYDDAEAELIARLRGTSR